VGRLQRKNQIIGIAIVVIVAFLAPWYRFYRANRAPLSEREIATRVMAEYVRKAANPHSVLVVSNPYVERAGRGAEAYQFQKAAEAGLRKGFGSEVTVKAGFAKLKPEAVRDVTSIFVPPNCTTPLSYLITDTAVDDLLRDQPDCDVLVSVIGLPANTASAPFWLKPAPKIALLLPDFTVLVDPNVIRHAFKSGKIVAAVIPKRGAPPAAKSLGPDYKAEFERRFVLVTAENIDQMLPTLLR
jgi:hypothetical protein